jgi:signal transduction histidine kinase/ligand-binding sensor domain-containing protein
VLREFLIYIILAIFSLVETFAQIKNQKFYHITRDDGLSQSTVNCIVKGSQGYMWFGTNDGIDRYDGYQFIYYRHDEENLNSIGLGRVNILYTDSGKRLWVGTDQGGLSFYDPQSDQFIPISAIEKLYPETNNDIRDITGTGDGRIWIASYGKGLILYDPEKNEIQSIAFQLIPEISSLEYSKSGDLYIGSSHGLYKIDHALHIDETIVPQYITELKNIPVISLYTSSTGLIWIGTYGNGAYSYNPVTKELKEYSTNGKTSPRLNHGIVRDIIEDADGNILFATGGGGLNFLHSGTNSIEYIQYRLNYQNGLNTNILYSLYRDDIGNLWIGTYNGGANILFKAKDKFGHIKSYGAEDDLSNNAVLAILEAPDGKLFIGTDGGGLDIFDPIRHHFTHIKHDPGNRNSVCGDVIKSLYFDSKGILWIGTFNNGLTAYNLDKNKFSHYTHQPGSSEGLSFNNIWDLDEDAKGNIWIATLGGGLDMYNPGKNCFTNFQNSPQDSNSISDNVISSILIDSKGVLWVGTEYGGVCKSSDPERGSFKAYNRTLNKEIISSNQISTIFEDSHGNIWVGTIGGGLNLYDKTKDKFITYNESDGLPNNLVYAILEDLAGNLWISTNNGLSKFINGTDQPSSPVEFVNYTAGDGLQSNEFSPQSACITRQGILYFGGINGINYFDPAKIITNDHIPPIIITGFKIFNKDVDHKQPGSPIKQPISLTKEIKLSYEQSMITFEFAALDFTAPSENQYKYMLEGFEENWNDVGNQRSATYTNLNPGTYTFKVIGSNNDNIWNNKGVSLKLTITPPFYRTWVFRITLTFLIVIGILGFFRLRLHSLETHRKLLRKMVDERTKELLSLNSLLEKRNQEIQDQQEELVIQKENLIKVNEEMERNQIKIKEQNIELEEHHHNLEELVKLRTRELETAKQRAEESDLLKTSFLSNMSHEIRTPLNAIVGFSSLLTEEDLNDEEKLEFIKQINSNTEILLVLIDDILDLAKIESNQLSIVNTDVQLNEFIDELHKTFLLREPSNFEFRVNNSLESHDLVINTDRTRLRQILINLLDNSFKFTEKGYIELGSLIRKKNLILYVEDSGIGMSGNVLDRIYERFYKIERSIEKIYRGTGLGLTITKKLVSMLGGRIHVASKEGEGTRFEVSIPLTTK